MNHYRLICTISAVLFLPWALSHRSHDGSFRFGGLVELASASDYRSTGIGGGGAMSGFSISPYSSLWFVGTDMGTLFRSPDAGKTWSAIDQREADFSAHLSRAAYIGFSSDPMVVFSASAGIQPKRSTDAGITWNEISIPLNPDEWIQYWTAHSLDPNFMLCSTNQGLLRSNDQGLSWDRIQSISGEGKGTFVDSEKNQIYHATIQGVFRSDDGGVTFTSYYTNSTTGIRGFTGGRDEDGFTLALIDTNGDDACKWAWDAPDSTWEAKVQTIADCGYIWLKNGENGTFTRTSKEGGQHLKMAENNSKVVYVTGGQWVRQYGTKIWVSQDAGQSWQLKFHQFNWDVPSDRPYEPWPKEKLEYSSIGLEVGWDDSNYESFSINNRNAFQAGGTGYYFLHTTENAGDTWKSPFTEFADFGDRVRGKRWKSVGLEVTSILRLKFHPKNPNIGFASASDIGGLVTEDKGQTWRVSKVYYNTNYDYAFSDENINTVFAASGDMHDFPNGGYGDVTNRRGGVFRSDDMGHTWKRLTSEADEFNRQFLSVAYDSKRKVLYAGSQGGGILRSTDQGATWSWINAGLPKTELIIPQIEIDPLNGNVYAVLSGDAPTYSHPELSGIYFLDVKNAKPKWVLLRGTVNRPDEVNPAFHHPWWYPVSFAIDFTDPNRNTLWLVDTERQGAWLATGAWKSVDRGRTWNRKLQFTQPTQVLLDPIEASNVYVSGSYALDGSWGQGGAYSSNDGGETWTKNTSFPLLRNLHATTLDPIDPSQLFYLFFGGGMLHGPRPE